MEVIQLIKYSPKRQSIFETIISQQNSLSTAGIRTLCPTRWTMRSGAMQAIISNYEELQDKMKASSHGSDDCSRRANGIMALMERFSTYFGLKLSILIISITEQMSIHLQSKERSVEDGYFVVDTYLKSLKKLRSDTEFKKFFDTVKQDCVDICDPPTLPRRRQISRSIDTGSSQHEFTSVDEFYRKEYFEVIDNVTGLLENRFQQEGFLLMRKMERLLLDSANSREVVIADEIKNLYSADIDFDKLSLQLKLLPDAIKAVPLQGIRITQVTKLQTICTVFEEQHSLKVILSEIHKLIRIYLTVPVTTATAERSFSALRRMKTYLRNSMTQQRLNHCMILHVHREETDKLNLIEIAKEFVEKNDRRKQFFGQFC